MIRLLILVIYALLIFTGGLIGFIKSQSVASVAMGSVSAGLLLFLAYGMYKQCYQAFLAAVGVTTVLFAFFSYRFYAKGVFMPPGLIALLSLGMLAVLLWPGEKVAAVK